MKNTTEKNREKLIGYELKIKSKCDYTTEFEFGSKTYYNLRYAEAYYELVRNKMIELYDREYVIQRVYKYTPEIDIRYNSDVVFESSTILINKRSFHMKELKVKDFIDTERDIRIQEILKNK
jgi:hypothetical protein